MKPPKSANDYPDRAIDCQQTMHEEVIELIMRGAHAGWSEEEATAAVMEICRNHLIGLADFRLIEKILQDRDEDE